MLIRPRLRVYSTTHLVLEVGIPHPHSLRPLPLPVEQEEVDRNPGSPLSLWVEMAAYRTMARPGSRTRLITITSSSRCHGAHVGEKG